MGSDIAVRPQIAVVAEGVEKCFVAGIRGCSARVGALRGATLSVRRGESVVLIGGAGAGKTTLLLCMAGLLRADAGVVRWFGARVPDYARIAYVKTLAQAHEAEERLTARAPGILLIDLAVQDLASADQRALECLATRATARGIAAVLSSRRVPHLRTLTWRGALMERGVVHELAQPADVTRCQPIRVAEERIGVG